MTTELFTVHPFSACCLHRQAGIGAMAALTTALICCDAAAYDSSRTVPTAAMSTMEIKSGLYQLHPVRAHSTALRLNVTKWIQERSGSRFGLMLSLASNLPQPAHAKPFAFVLPQFTQSPDVGVRWRSQLNGTLHLDITAWKHPLIQSMQSTTPDVMGLIRHRDQNSYGTRVEVQWATSGKRGLAFESGAIGVQLEGHSRVVLRAKGGGPMVYLRTKF